MRAIPAGELKFRIQFERPTVARGNAGTKKATSWASLGYCRAAVVYGTGAEQRDAGVEQASQHIKFRCRKGSVSSTVLATDRIVHLSLNWDITGIAVLPTNPIDIEFTAVASRG